MKTLTIAVYLFSELNKAAQDKAIQYYQDIDYFSVDAYHRKAEFEESVKIFTNFFNSESHQFHTTGDHAKKALVKIIQAFNQQMAKSNRFYAVTFEESFQSNIQSIDQAIASLDNLPLTGVYCDYFLLDAITEYLKGSNHQNLSLGDLFKVALSKAKNESKKDRAYVFTKKYAREYLMEFCEDMFYEDGSNLDSKLDAMMNAA